MESVVQALALFSAAAVATLLAPVLLVGCMVVDLVGLQWRLPRTRIAAFGLCWFALESAGLLAAAFLWLTGRGGRHGVHFRLQRWWSHAMVRVLERTIDLRVHVEGLEQVTGSAVILARHVSLLDALLTAELVSYRAGLNPRMVLKADAKSP